MNDLREYEAMAKLDLPDHERQWVSAYADMLLESFQALDEVDALAVAPLVTVMDIQNVMREDISTKMLTREELLSNAPEQYDGYFQAPKTLD